MKKSIYLVRGDTRDKTTLESHGGFVPKYLLEEHNDGIDGFKACKLKTAKTIGCGHEGFSQDSLFDKARKQFLDALSDPTILQQHVMFNNVGFLSSALDKSDSYFGHNYRIDAECHEFSLLEAAEKYKKSESFTWKKWKRQNEQHQTGYPPKVFKDYKIYVDNLIIGQATLLAMTPRGGVELTFISPVLYKNITYIGKKE